MIADNRVWFGRTGRSRPRLKKFLSESEGVTTWTWWPHAEAGHNQEATKEVDDVMGRADVFDNPKPTRLIRRLLQLATEKDSIVLDAFPGSSTTGHAVMQLNREDGGNRRFILVEIDANICRNVTAERLRRVCQGYANSGGSRAEGLGGGFRFVALGDALFDERGNIKDVVRFPDLARHVYFVETGEPLPRERVPHTPLIGVCRGTGIYLLYNGILKDKSPDGGNVLTTAVLSALPGHDGSGEGGTYHRL